MKNLFFGVLFLFSLVLSAQNFNEYKYIIVPKKFDAFKKVDQYRSNALVKFLFTKKGYTVVYDDNLPQELNANRCLGLKVDLIDDSGMFSTKTSITLKDCNTKTIYTTKLGKSKEKEYLKSYNEAIRKAFKSFDGISYIYKSKAVTESPQEPVVIIFKDDVKKVEEKEVISVSFDKVAKKASNTAAVTSVSEAVLYAQKISNGFQLVDSTPKIQYKIYKTTVEGYYIATHNTATGVVINKNGKWFFESYQNDKLIAIELHIKF